VRTKNDRNKIKFKLSTGWKVLSRQGRGMRWRAVSQSERSHLLVKYAN